MMSRVAKGAFFYLLFAMTLMAVGSANAETPPEPPAAPIPTQILASKRVFISHGEAGEENWLGIRDLTYDEFYALIKNWGRWEIASSPADADLVFEIRYVPDYTDSPPLVLTILDPKTHTTLWSFTERVGTSGRSSKGRKNFDKAMATIVENLKNLVTTSNKSTK